MSEDERPLLALAERLAELPAGPRRAARLIVQEERLILRHRARRASGLARLFDSVSKFGGGSLLTAVLLLILRGRLEVGVVVTAATTLIALLGGIISTLYSDRKAARLDHAAERLEILLKEVE